MSTCIISTAAAISSTPGIELSNRVEDTESHRPPSPRGSPPATPSATANGIMTSVVSVPITNAVRNALDGEVEHVLSDLVGPNTW